MCLSRRRSGVGFKADHSVLFKKYVELYLSNPLRHHVAHTNKVAFCVIRIILSAFLVSK